jgi:hypothetical protein
MPRGEEHRVLAINALARALAYRDGVSAPSVAQAAVAFRPAAEEIVDHLVAHAVETARAVAEADEELADV